MSDKLNKTFSGFSHKIFITNKKKSLLKSRSIKQEDEVFKNFNNVKFPKNAMVELTAGCNHSCVFCTNPRMSISGKNLDIDLYSKFVSDAVALGLEEIGFYMRGEPLLDKRLEEFVQIASDGGVKYIYITTNGALADIDKVKKLVNAGLSSIKFSINAASREKYKLTHGKDEFDKVLKNLKDVYEYKNKEKSDLKIMASFVVTKFTEDEIEEYKKVIIPYVDDAKILGVHGQMGQALEELKMLESTKLTANFDKIDTSKPCPMLWNRIHLTQDGMLSLCCVDYDNNLIYADLNKESLKDAWNNQIISEMRKRHIEKTIEGTLCHKCLYGSKDAIKPLLEHDFKNRKKSLVKKGVKSVVERIFSLRDIHDKSK